MFSINRRGLRGLSKGHTLKKTKIDTSFKVYRVYTFFRDDIMILRIVQASTVIQANLSALRAETNMLIIYPLHNPNSFHFLFHYPHDPKP